MAKGYSLVVETGETPNPQAIAHHAFVILSSSKTAIWMCVQSSHDLRDKIRTPSII